MFIVKISISKFTTSSWKFTLPLPPENLSVSTSSINVQISLVLCPPPSCDIDLTNWYYCDLIRVPHTSLENQHFQGWVGPPPLNTLKPRPQWWSGPPDKHNYIHYTTYTYTIHIHPIYLDGHPPSPEMWYKSNKLVWLQFNCSKTLYSINVELYLLKPKFQTKYYLLRIKCFKTCNLREGGRKKWYFNMHN